jgi:hypothetical protein
MLRWGKTMRLNGLGEAAAQDGVVHPLRRRQLGDRNPVQPGEECLRLADAALARLRAEIVDPAVEIAHPERGRLHRILLQQPAIMFLHQRLEIVLRRGSGGRDGEGEQGGGGQEAAHRILQRADQAAA